jgi:sn-glycerol 3-phosphate transport system substrate-binding protein
MNSSASRAGVIANAKDFEVGFAPLPYYDDVIEKPMNSIIGGATLWVLQGRPEAEYKGVAKFFTYLSQPEVQAEWHQFSGYLPITPAAYELSKEQGYYDKNPGADVAIKQLTRVTPDANSKGIRFGNYVQIRKIESDDAVAMLGGQMSPKEAVDDIVKRGNELLREFEAANQ